MSPKFVCCVISICFSLCPFLCTAESSESCPIFKSKPPQDAYSPINIITKNAIRVNVSKTLYKNTGLGPGLFVNTGYAFEGYDDPAILSGGFLEGGVFCGVTYRFELLRFYTSKDLNGRSHNELDGKGSPLTLSAHFYDNKYKSFKEALKHPGGVAILNYMITYYESPIPNLLFTPTGIAVRAHSIAGTAFPHGSELLYFLWFFPLFYAREYYAFWGSYTDLVTGEEYPNVIQLQTAGIYPFISKSQMKVFRNLKNKNGTMVENVLPLRPGGQTIYQVGPNPGAFFYIPTDIP